MRFDAYLRHRVVRHGGVVLAIVGFSATGTKIMAQDQHVDELVQVGLRSRFAIRSRYSWQEGAQREFNGWLVPRYQDCWRARRRQLS